MSTEPTPEQLDCARKAIHRALASNWMTVTNALGGDQAEYEAFIDSLADAALTAAAVVAQPEPEYEYAREAVFVRGNNRYDDDMAFRSREEAEANIRICNEGEADEPEDLRVNYYLVRRVTYAPGEWEPVPSEDGRES